MLDYDMRIFAQALDDERELAHRFRLLRMPLPAFVLRSTRPAPPADR